MTQYSVEAVLKATGADNFAREFARAGEATNSLDKDAQKASVSVGSLLKAIGVTKLVSTGFDMMKSSVGGAISRFDTLNNFPKIMEKLGFSANESSKAIEKLSEGTDGLPTPLDEIAKVTQRITSMTGDLDGAVDTSLALNNAFIASGASTADASRGLDQYVQMLAKGEVDLQSWRTLQETMPYALQESAKAFGFTGKSAQNDFYDALKDGEITMDEFNDKLIELSTQTGGFAEVAKTATGGIATAWSRLRTAMVRNIEKTIRAINDLLEKNGLLTFEGMIDAVRVAIDNAFGLMIKLLPKIIDYFKDLWKTLEPFHEVIKLISLAIGVFVVNLALVNSTVKLVVRGIQILSAVFALLTAPMTLIILAISAVIAALVYFYNTNEEVKQIVDTVWKFIKETVIKAVEVISEKVHEIWGALTEWWKQNGDEIKNSAFETWNGLKELIAPIIESTIEFIKELWNSLKEFWSTYGDEIVGIALLAWELLHTSVMTQVSLLYEGIMAIIDWFKLFWEEHGETIIRIGQNAWEFLSETVVALVEGLYAFISFLLDEFQAFWDQHGAAIIQIAQYTWEFIMEVITGVLDTLIPIFDGFFQFLADAWNFLQPIVALVWEGIKLTIGIILDAIGLIINLALALIEGDWEGAWSAVEQFASDVWKRISDVVSRYLDEILVWLATKLAKLYNVVREKFNFVLAFTGQIWARILTTIVSKAVEIVTSVRNKFTEIVTLASNKFNETKQAITNKMTEAKQAVSTKISEMVQAVKNKASEMVSAGINLIQGLIDGIKQMAGNAVSAAKSVVSDAIAGAKSLLGIKSPSRVFMQFGRYTSQGLAIGIEDDAHRAVSSVENMANDMMNAFNPELDYNSQLSSELSNASRLPTSFNHIMENKTTVLPVLIKVDADAEWLRAYIDEENAVDSMLSFN